MRNDLEADPRLREARLSAPLTPFFVIATTEAVKRVESKSGQRSLSYS